MRAGSAMAGNTTFDFDAESGLVRQGAAAFREYQVQDFCVVQPKSERRVVFTTSQTATSAGNEVGANSKTPAAPSPLTVPFELLGVELMRGRALQHFHDALASLRLVDLALSRCRHCELSSASGFNPVQANPVQGLMTHLVMLIKP